MYSVFWCNSPFANFATVERLVHGDKMDILATFEPELFTRDKLRSCKEPVRFFSTKNLICQMPNGLIVFLQKHHVVTTALQKCALPLSTDCRGRIRLKVWSPLNFPVESLSKFKNIPAEISERLDISFYSDFCRRVGYIFKNPDGCGRVSNPMGTLGSEG